MATATLRSWRAACAAALTVLCLGASSISSAALFEDDEARRAILDLRQKLDAQRAASDRQADELRRSGEDASQLRRSLLDLQTQIESLRGEIARLNGQNEQLLRDVADMQRRQKDLAQGVEDRLRKVEPSKVSVDGREFIADPNEAKEFEGALATFRKGEFPAAQTQFAEFVRRYPQSGFRPTALFWLGNSQYANRDYRGAITNFRALLAAAPDHPRAPEAVLSIANCQIELKDNAGARRTLDELVKAYPQSEAAAAAKERLARLR
ncbi:tol-pal system protein YbgF [Ramlibacter sp.]|uniref:tol-pal system protein YbgF n=1 Tax=Ramlibacter sp. TaxID=1917967 RepID=UPI002BFD8B3D|nr:tol-pal system protein YbgF [Ramlibacter sp.]HWI84635.1 tol-pal system protein YbgF [Ramlibacter sp.]